MKTKPCPDCGNHVSQTSQNCPNCRRFTYWGAIDLASRPLFFLSLVLTMIINISGS